MGTVQKTNTKNSPKIFGALGTSQVPVRSRKIILKIHQKYLGPWGPPRCPYGPEKKYKKFPKNIWGPGDLPGARTVPKKILKIPQKYLGPWGPPRCPYGPEKNTKNSPKMFAALGTSQVPVRPRKKILKIHQKYLGPWGPP